MKRALLLCSLAACVRGAPPDTLPVAAAPTRAAGYAVPPQNILDVLHAPAPKRPIVSPTRDRALLVSWVRFPPMSQVAEPYLKLAGVRLEPRTRRKHDTPGGYGVAPCADALSIVDLASSVETAIALPADGCVDGFTWAADGKRYAFRNTSRDAVELWTGDASGATHRLGDVRLNPMLGSSLQWAPDQRTLLVKAVPADPGPPPPADSATSDGPSVQETDGKSGEFSTYEARDTLRDEADEARFGYYGTSQILWVDATSGATTRVGPPGVYGDVDLSPDGSRVLVESVQKPYSHAVTWDRFAHRIEVWDRAGASVTLADLPVADRVPVNGVPVGPRGFGWRATEPATLVWAEALDGGDWNVDVPARDRVMTESAPFAGPPSEITRTVQRFAGLEWSEKPDVALLREIDANRHWKRTMLFDMKTAKSQVLWDMSSDERYLDPGQPVHKVLPDGVSVIRQDGSTIYLAGAGSSPDGDRPFLDRFDLDSRASVRLFRSARDAYESFVDFLGDGTDVLLTSHQSPDDPPNLVALTLGATVSAPDGEATRASTARQLTHIPDPTPIVRQVHKRLIKYRRKDGTELSFTLLTPPGYQEGTRVPAILSAYPLDYADAKAAGQVSGSDRTFSILSGYRLLLLAGYAIIDQAAFPIVGDPKKAYDTYVPQLVDDAQAAVDAAVATGVVDPDRIGVTGHSHGALMTVNLLAHTDLFRAGAATSGSYNKTLTPFGFQNERRSVWKATDVYLTVSPFFLADRLKTPLLIVHGEEDANPGTTPVQASLLYEAIRGNGGTARLVMLPHEPHWYSAMESNEQVAWEELAWFDRYVKQAPPRAAH
jgi:dipeptidyl aminopeptidase/acylaminoacyl peptidase